MVPKPIKIGTLVTAVAAILVMELGAGWVFHHVASLAVIGLTRLVQIAAIVIISIQMEGGLAAVGFAPQTWLAGLKTGACWALGFALIAGIAMWGGHAMGFHPLAMIRQPLPASPVETILFFVVGGLIAPLAEEICFRGVLYTYFRKWGILLALVASTALFVALHSVNGIPFTQIIGGLVFAVAYETSGNLMVPVVIHTSGNLAIFFLSLF